MRICFLPDGLDGAGCYRCIFPMAYLGRRGHEASMPAFRLYTPKGEPVAPYPGEGLLERVPPGEFLVAFFEETVPDADIYVFQRGTHDWQLDWARRLKQDGKLVVLDTDDDLHRIPRYNPAKLDRFQNPTNNRQNMMELLKIADLATFATKALERFYGRWNPRTVVIPNFLHWGMWEPLEAVYDRQEWRRLRVGYMGNMDFHRDDLVSIAAPLRKWLVANPDVEFVAAGDPRIHDVIGVPDNQRVTTSKVWFRNLDLPYVTSTFDIGLVPLVRNEFNECKSWLKGLEYSACGIVPLCSPTESYRGFIDDGENGFLCKHPREFVAALDRLQDDPVLRRQMGVHARERARAFSLDNHVDEWEAAYAGLCDHADRAREGVAA